MGIALKLERIAIIQVRETYSQLQGNNENTGSVKFEQLSFPQELASPQQKAIQGK